MQIPCSFYFSRVFLSFAVQTGSLPPILTNRFFFSFWFPSWFGYILLPMAAHLFAFVLLPLRHVPAARVASFQPPSSLLCIAHFYSKGYGGVQDRWGVRGAWGPKEKNSAHRKNRNEIFIIRQSKIFLSAFLACCFWGVAQKFHRHASGCERKIVGPGKKKMENGRWALGGTVKSIKICQKLFRFRILTKCSHMAKP